MTQISANHPLVNRIAALRARARFLLALYGAGFTLGTFGAGVIGLVTADYLFHIDNPGVRLGLMVGLLGAVGAVAWRKLVMPLSTKLTDQFLASRVELVNKSLADELMSALQFIRQDTGRDNIMALKVVEGAQERAAGVKFEAALELRVATRSILGATAVMLVIGIAGMANYASGTTGIAFSRWLNPFAGKAWPHDQDVAFDWSAFPGGQEPEVLPQGEPVTITAKVTRGFKSNLLASVYFSSDTTRETRDLMTLQEARSTNGTGVYQKDITALGEKSMALRVVAGDYSAQTNIRLAARPQISSMKSTVTPPAYVTGDSAVARMFDLRQESGRAVEGSRVHLLVKSSKPISVVNGVPAVAILRDDRDELMPVEGIKKELTDPFDADLSFVASKSLDFRMEVRDTDGFTNAATATMRMDVVADAMPSVIISEPRHEVEVVPDADVNLKINVSDDLGLSELWLQANRIDGKPVDAAKFPLKLELENQVADGAARTVVATTNYKWKLADLNLKPGDRLNFYALVRDNYAMPEGQAGQGDNFEKGPGGMVLHKLVQSASLSLVVKSKDQIAEEKVQELEHIAAEIQQLDAQEKVTHGKTEVIQKAMEASSTATAQQQADLQQLAQEQTSEAQRANAIQQKIEQIRDTLAANKMDQDQLGLLAQKASDVMKDVGQQDMPKATGNLNQAKEAAQNAQQQKSDAASKAQATAQAQAAAQQAKAAEGNEQTADEKMAQIANEIMQKGQLAQAQQKIGELLDRTQKNEQATKEAAKTTQGKDPGDLTAQEKAALDKVAQEQKDLAAEQQKLQERLQAMAKDMQQSNPSGAKAADQAAQTSQSQQVGQKQSQAGQSAQQNQTNSAQQQQQQAEAGLQQMQKDINSAQKYEQERIAAETAKLLEELRKVFDTQTTAKGDADKAGEKAASAALKPLGDRESRMNMNLVGLRDRSAALPEMEQVVDDLKTAQGGMQDATGTLYKGDQPPSVKSEADVLVALGSAIDKLQKKKDANDAKAAIDDLAAIRKQYEEALAKEKAFRSSVTTMEQHREARGDLPGADQTKLGEMATSQGDLAELVHTLTTGKLQTYEEYVWPTNQIVDFMGESKNRMAKAETGKEVASAQDSAILRLNFIIAALKEEEQEKEKFLKDQGGGGGGGGGGGKKPLIATSAELKMLKNLEVINNDDTIAKNKALSSAANAGEKSDIKRQIEHLGDDQNAIRDLMQRLIEKSQKQQ